MISDTRWNPPVAAAFRAPGDDPCPAVRATAPDDDVAVAGRKVGLVAADLGREREDGRGAEGVEEEGEEGAGLVVGDLERRE